MQSNWSSRAGLVNVRPAVAADVPELESIAKAAYLPYVPRMGFLPPPATADFAGAVSRGEAWLARVREGDADPDPARAAGLIVLVASSAYLLVENVAVLPSMHGFGIGTGLLAFAEDHARALGLPETRLYTNIAMTENQGLYERRGYVETHREAAEFGRVYYTKPL
ncbi:MAG TPA: GNAT family N-acetyltransferase [Streptosporangiaceae bacterium]|nr:GNAT family N-acetyltransferase [Streptosporangiaceae bacterium]